jgi:hypothetical protein
MADSEKYRVRIRNILQFSTSLTARTMIGVSITLIVACLFYVISYLLPRLWAFILNAISNAMAQ